MAVDSLVKKGECDLKSKIQMFVLVAQSAIKYFSNISFQNFLLHRKCMEPHEQFTELNYIQVMISEKRYL